MTVESLKQDALKAWRQDGPWMLVVPLCIVGLILAVWLGAAPPPKPIPSPDIRKQIAAGPPKVEPVELLNVSREDAEAINAKVPFSTAPIVAAKPFHFGKGSENYERARDCLASAVYYEAGDDAVGEKSVAQVVLNRARHPAFPRSICAVIYQGQERATGCQFSFTCDGSMTRRTPSPAAWTRAKQVAAMALGGFVDKSVGLATHYHTDWVVPYWSSSLDKISKVRTHLFFRFKGYWGQAAAMSRGGGGVEPEIAKLASLSTVHGLPESETGPFIIPKQTDADIASLVAKLQERGIKAVPAPGTGRPQVSATFTVGDAVPKKGQERLTISGSPDLKGNSLAASDPDRGLYGLRLDLNRFPGSYALVARSLCGTKSRCTVLGWRRDAAPSGMGDFQAKRGKALFSYRREGGESVEWDCTEFPEQAPQCMAGTAAKALPGK